ncbi:hypothetical protein MHU86_24785 [Fragilaria crotonensis]|nr:hypothetical protein MHU86_24785 [Fragilaria crotonensis]
MTLEKENDNENADTQHLAELSADLLLSACYHFTSTIPAALLFHQRRARQRRRFHRKRRPAPSLFEQRLVWDTFCSRHSARSDFARHIRMSHDSFNKLLSAIEKDLEVDGEMAKLRVVRYCLKSVYMCAFVTSQGVLIQTSSISQGFRLHHSTKFFGRR